MRTTHCAQDFSSNQICLDRDEHRSLVSRVGGACDPLADERTPPQLRSNREDQPRQVRACPIGAAFDAPNVGPSRGASLPDAITRLRERRADLLHLTRLGSRYRILAKKLCTRRGSGRRTAWGGGEGSRRRMPTFYRGIAPNTFLHGKDLRVDGMQPRASAVSAGIDAIMDHIAWTATLSPYISLTRSFGVAADYAKGGPGTPPGHVYVVRMDAAQAAQESITLLDPVLEIAKVHADPFATATYHHNGAPNFILALVDQLNFAGLLKLPAPCPPNATSTGAPPAVSKALEALVRALRDAEILAKGSIPRALIVDRIDIP